MESRIKSKIGVKNGVKNGVKRFIETTESMGLKLTRITSSLWIAEENKGWRHEQHKSVVSEEKGGGVCERYWEEVGRAAVEKQEVDWSRERDVQVD